MIFKSILVSALSATALAASSSTLTPFTTSSTRTRSLAPAQTASVTTPPAYCATGPSIRPPSLTGSTIVVPPIPCPGGYLVQEGLCCSRGVSDCDAGNAYFSLPLAGCVTSNPAYNGCPGNMLDGICCDGPEVGLVAMGGGPTSVSCGGKSLFSVTVSNGLTLTSSFGDSSATTTGTGNPVSVGTGSASTTLSTSSSGGVPTAAAELGVMALGAAGALLAAL